MPNTVGSKTRASSGSKTRASSGSKTRASSGSKTRASSTTVRARIDEKTKDEAAAVLAAIGLTVSDAFRLMMVRIAKDKAIPFDPLLPNAETIEAMKEARRGGHERYRNTKALLKSLNADD